MDRAYHGRLSGSQATQEFIVTSGVPSVATAFPSQARSQDESREPRATPFATNIAHDYGELIEAINSLPRLKRFGLSSAVTAPGFNQLGHAAIVAHATKHGPVGARFTKASSCYIPTAPRYCDFQIFLDLWSQVKVELDAICITTALATGPYMLIWPPQGHGTMQRVQQVELAIDTKSWELHEIWYLHWRHLLRLQVSLTVLHLNVVNTSRSNPLERRWVEDLHIDHVLIDTTFPLLQSLRISYALSDAEGRRPLKLSFDSVDFISRHQSTLRSITLENVLFGRRVSIMSGEVKSAAMLPPDDVYVGIYKTVEAASSLPQLETFSFKIHSISEDIVDRICQTARHNIDLGATQLGGPHPLCCCGVYAVDSNGQVRRQLFQSLAKLMHVEEQMANGNNSGDRSTFWDFGQAFMRQKALGVCICRADGNAVPLLADVV